MDPTILISFDACERETVEALLAAGELPNLRRIINAGYWTALEPQPIGLHGLPWPSFLRGEKTLDHGWYAVKRWDAARMRLEAKLPDWIVPSAFWEQLDSRRIALLDVPFAPPPPDDFRGLVLQGWQTHDQQERYTRPRRLWPELCEGFGPPVTTRELCAPHDPKRLLAVRRDTIAAIEQFRDICAWVLQRQRWDLFLAVFGGAHRIGHYLWDLSQAVAAKPDRGVEASLRAARDEVYCACDRALGRLLDHVPARSRVLVFSLHGMAAETGWPDVFPRLLGQIRGIGAPPVGEGGLLFRVKQAMPNALVQRVVRRMPYSVDRMIVPLWSQRMHDWDKIRCFTVPGGDSNSLIRINVIGREACGTVQPGHEYAELCAKIEAGLESFRVIDTGVPVVAKIERADQAREDFDVLRSRIPDLVVHWNPIPAYETKGVTSPEHGHVEWEPGWRIPSGRSGDHSPRGWLAAYGPDVPNLRSDAVEDIAALAPAIRQWLTDAGPRDWPFRS